MDIESSGAGRGTLRATGGVLRETSR